MKHNTVLTLLPYWNAGEGPLRGQGREAQGWVQQEDKRLQQQGMLHSPVFSLASPDSACTFLSTVTWKWCVPCDICLQSDDPTASGDSDKSKSEVNDEDEEVRAGPPLLSLVHSTAVFTLYPNPNCCLSETCFAGWRVMHEALARQAVAVNREVFVVVSLTRCCCCRSSLSLWKPSVPLDVAVVVPSWSW